MMQELRAVFSGGLASCLSCPERQSRYRQWICANCPELTEEKVSPSTLRFLALRALGRAGYPFRRTELDFEDWLALGQIEELIANLHGPASGGTGNPPASPG
jgi:hypothetical protein